MLFGKGEIGARMKEYRAGAPAAQDKIFVVCEIPAIALSNEYREREMVG